MQHLFSLRSAAALLALLLLGGCGFALRGTADLPPALQTLQLTSLDGGSEIVREMRRALLNNEVTVEEEARAGLYQLGLGLEQTSERPLSVNATARAGEYELTMSLPFQLRNGADLVLGPETLSISRVYLADPENAVAKNEEAELIRSEMRRELALQVMRRLQSLPL